MRKEFLFVCIAVFLIVFGTFLAAQVFVPFTAALGGTSFTIGMISASMYCVRLVFSSPIGRFAQKYGTVTVIKYSLMLYPIIAGAYYFAWNIPSLIVARLLHGLASAMMLPMAMAYIGENSPFGQEGRYLGIYNTIYYLASASGPVAGGLIYESYGVQQAFLALFILSIFSLGIILIIPTNQKQKKASSPIGVYVNSDKMIKELITNKKLLALTVITFVYAILMTLLGLWLQQLLLKNGLKMGTIGCLIAMFSLIIGIMQVPFGSFVDRCRKLMIFVLSGIFATFFVLMLPLIDHVWLMAVIIAMQAVFISLNLAVWSSFSVVFGKEAGMSNVMGLLGSVNSAGIIIGSLLLGGITDLLGINAAFYLAGIVFLIGELLFMMLWFNNSEAIVMNVNNKDRKK